MKKLTIKCLALLFTLILISSSLFGCAEIQKIIDGLYGGDKNNETIPTGYVLKEGDMSFHFMMLGNEWAGDCIYIKAGNNDVLIDAGSRANSVQHIKTYVNQFVKDNTLEYVIATHADRDHIAGFAASESIFDLYVCETIIDFSMSNSTTVTYGNYKTNRDEEVQNGAKHYTALECYNNVGEAKRVYQLSEDMSMEILYNYYYDHKSDDENNYSVCLMFKHKDKNFLFTGDLEKEGEEYLVQYNNLPQVELFKAGHHGSKTSSNDVLLNIIKPKISVVCCCAGSVEYTQTAHSTFPTQAYVDRISKYTDRVYVPIYVDVTYDQTKEKYVNGEVGLLNGNIIVCSPQDQEIDGVMTKLATVVMCSNNDTKLKDTEWFKKNRDIPNAWKN